MVSDLSTRHDPLGGLFPDYPQTPEAWEQYRLSDEQVAFFHENGYLSPIKVLGEEQIKTLRKELESLLDPAHPGHDLFYEFHTNQSEDAQSRLFHALGAWRIEPGFHDILWAPAMVMAASQLLDSAVRFWHDQLFYKPAKHGGVVAWHQDYSYWTRSQPMGHLTCWIGLDDVTTENGCVHYVPRSHRWNLLPITGLAGDMEAIREVLTDEQFETFQHPVAVELAAGEASFHHPLMIHGSFENRSDRPRRGVVVNVFKDGTRSASDEPLLEGVPPIADGKKIDGQFFPLLFDGNR